MGGSRNLNAGLFQNLCLFQYRILQEGWHQCVVIQALPAGMFWVRSHCYIQISLALSPYYSSKNSTQWISLRCYLCWPLPPGKTHHHWPWQLSADPPFPHHHDSLDSLSLSEDCSPLSISCSVGLGPHIWEVICWHRRIDWYMCFISSSINRGPLERERWARAMNLALTEMELLL